jgi:DNA-binding XRE family transcriptional regulator
MSEKSETVTLSRAEYEALIERLEEAEDLATVAAAEARETALGKEEARADYLPIELVRRLSAGEHPARVWRAHRGLSREALAAAAGVAPSYLTEIETRRKPGQLRRARQDCRGFAHLARRSRSLARAAARVRSISFDHLVCAA